MPNTTTPDRSRRSRAHTRGSTTTPQRAATSPHTMPSHRHRRRQHAEPADSHACCARRALHHERAHTITTGSLAPSPQVQTVVHASHRAAARTHIRSRRTHSHSLPRSYAAHAAARMASRRRHGASTHPTAEAATAFLSRVYHRITRRQQCSPAYRHRCG